MKLLREFVENIVIMEITARRGPRTGGFDFDESFISQVLEMAKNIKDSIKDTKTFKPVKHVLNTRNPITGKNTRIPFIFYYDIKTDETALFYPYQNASGGKIHINLAKFLPDSLWSRSIITHELTHLFDKQKPKSLSPEAGYVEYTQNPREKHAFLQQFISEMLQMAKSISLDIDSGKESAKVLSQTLIKKPHYLLRNVVNRDTSLRTTLGYYLDDVEFMKKLLQAAYSIVQTYLVR